MKLKCLLTCVVLGVAAIGGGPASANTCQAGGMTCPTGMPLDGYCECTSHGVTKDGTVVRVSRPSPRHTPDCRATPQAPGCPHP